jgi:titin
VKAINAVGTGPAGTIAGTPFGKPLAPTGILTGPQDAQVVVAWSAADAQGKPITQYTVTSTDPAVPAVVVPGTQRFAIVKNLTNGTAYSFKVKATNQVGDSPQSAVSAPVTPKFATTLSSVRTPLTSTSGSAVVYSGRLTRTKTGAAIGGATIVLTLKPEWGPTRTVSLATNGSGVWSYRFAPTYNTLVSARFGSDADDAAVGAPSYRMGVAPKITVTSPRNGSSSSAGSTLVVKGSVSPNKSGRTVYLVKNVNGKLYVVARAIVAKNSTYSFSVKPTRGTYVLTVTIGVSNANVGGTSGKFTVKRT